MKVYVLCSYSDELNDPVISNDYQELYKKMEKDYWATLEGYVQTENDKEYTYLSGYSASAVVAGDWICWSITELELPASIQKTVMTDLNLDIWNEWLKEKQQELEKIKSTLSPSEDAYRYGLIAGHINGLIDALTMQTTVETGKRFRKKLDRFRNRLLSTGNYDSTGYYIKDKA